MRTGCGVPQDPVTIQWRVRVRKGKGYVREPFTLAFLSMTVIASVSLGQAAENLLAARNPGFEKLTADLAEDGVRLKHGGIAYTNLPGWGLRVHSGEVKVNGDTEIPVEGENCLKFEILTEGKRTEVAISADVHNLKPNTIYELSAMIRPYGIDWVNSYFRFYEHDDERMVDSKHRRLINASTLPKFKRFSRRFVTHRNTTRGSLSIYWTGSRQRKGIITKKCMVWMDDIRLVEIGPALPLAVNLREGFEKDLSGWLIAEPGDGDDNNPKLSDEKAHSGKRSLKLSGTWGKVERIFSEEVTDSDVIIWFYDQPQKHSNSRMIMVEADHMRVGIGVKHKSQTNYTTYIEGDPRLIEITDIKRTTGWHEFRWAFSRGNGVTLYIDRKKVASSGRQDYFRSISLGCNGWQGFTCYLDDLMIVRKR